MEKVKETELVIQEKLSIMIELLMTITNCEYSDAYRVIAASKTYRYLKAYDYSALHDSPQANLCDIGKELRSQNHRLGQVITENNIKKAILKLREINLTHRKNQ